MGGKIKAVVFDLGGVLVDWNPRYLYRKFFQNDEAGMEKFLSEVFPWEWIMAQDAGRGFEEGEAILKARYPDKTELIEAWQRRYDEMIAGSIDSTVSILSDLHHKDVPLYALSNWSADTFPVAQKRFDFLKRFRGVVVSGQEKVCKPDARIFKILTDRYDLEPQTTIFIDDYPPNIAAAKELGFTAIHFTRDLDLRQHIRAYGVEL